MDQKTSGFTLVELMVVVGIIGLLLSLLLPSLSQARENARQSVCMHQQRGHHTAVTAYVESNNDYLPPLYDTTVTPTSPKVFDVDPTIGGMNGEDSEDYHHQMDILLYQGFADNDEKGTCPSDTHLLSDVNRSRLSYGVNWFLYAQHKANWGGAQTIFKPDDDSQIGSSGKGNYGPRNSSILSPSQQILISDQLQADGEPADVALTWHWSAVGLTDLERHDGKFVAGYQDGHTASKDPQGLFGFRYIDSTTTMLSEAVANRGWPAGEPPEQPGGPEGADFAATIFPRFAGWRNQPFSQDR